MPVRSYRRWKAEGPGRVSRDGAARLSNLMGIHKALRIVFSDAQRGYAWIKAGNSAFAGSSALDVMLGGELTDIMRVRRYLAAERDRKRVVQGKSVSVRVDLGGRRILKKKQKKKKNQ